MACSVSDDFKTPRFSSTRFIYEDILSDPAKEAGEILDVLGVVDDRDASLRLALAALEHDSQAGVSSKRGSDHITIPEDELRRCDDVFREVGLPLSVKMTVEEFRKFVH